MIVALRNLFNQTRKLKVYACPTRNSANLISGATLQSTLQIQAGPKFAKEMTPTVRNTLK